jgi:hypothetical protein
MSRFITVISTDQNFMYLLVYTECMHLQGFEMWAIQTQLIPLTKFNFAYNGIFGGLGHIFS